MSKVCRKCGDILVIGENIRPSRYARYDWQCNSCVMPSVIEANSDGYTGKVCRDCGVDLVVGENLRLGRGKKYDWQCNSCRKAKDKKRDGVVGGSRYMGSRARLLNMHAQAKGASGKLTGADLREVVAREATCKYCGEPVILDTLNFDHVIPVTRGGANTKENLVVACKRCNVVKSDMTIEELKVHMKKMLEHMEGAK